MSLEYEIASNDNYCLICGSALNDNGICVLCNIEATKPRFLNVLDHCMEDMDLTIKPRSNYG